MSGSVENATVFDAKKLQIEFDEVRGARRSLLFWMKFHLQMSPTFGAKRAEPGKVLMKSSQLGRKKAGVGIGAVLLLIASLISANATLGAQTTDCNQAQSFNLGGELFGTAFNGNHLLSITNEDGMPVIGPVSLGFTLTAGTYDVGGESTDGYVGRDTVSQPSEQWFAEFLDAGGNVLARTNTTGDIPDNIETGYWNGSLGSIELAADAVSVTFRHAAPGGANTPNSVRPICLGFTNTTPAPAPAVVCTEGQIEVIGADGAVESCDDPAPEPAPTSTIMVDFDSVAESTVTLTCTAGDGTDSESVDGTAVDIMFDPVGAGETCTVDYPAAGDLACTMSVTDSADGGEFPFSESVDGDIATKTIAFPADAAVDVKVVITCDEPVVTTDQDTASEPVVEAEEVSNDPDPEPEAEVEVLGAVVTAPVAQAETGTPTFTG